MSAADEARGIASQIAALREERDRLDTAITTKQAILADLERRIAHLADLCDHTAAQAETCQAAVAGLEARLVQAVHRAVTSALAAQARGRCGK